MELQDTIFKRQSVRKFKNQDVSDEDILKMIKAEVQHHQARIFKTGILLL